MAQKNKSSLIHTSKQNPEPHLDKKVEKEGGTMKAHEPIEGVSPDTKPDSVEGLRARLRSQKGN